MNYQKENSLVSVVIATFNGEKYLQQQLDSIFNQSYKNIEVIAVDDASTDNTYNILKEYSLKYKNLTIFLNEKNLGYIKNFEKGIMLSSGEFISLSDQDDVWHTDKIRLMVEEINECSLIYCDSFVCNENLETNGEKISDKGNLLDLNSCLQITIFSRINGNSILFKRELLENIIPFTEIVPHDWWINYNAILKNCIKYIDKPLVYYRQHAANTFGAIGRKEKLIKQPEIKNTYFAVTEHINRVNLFYEICPENLKYEKEVLYKLKESYKDFSFKNNFKRMLLFFKYKKYFLFPKKHSRLHKNFFPFKMFLKVK